MASPQDSVTVDVTLDHPWLGGGKSCYQRKEGNGEDSPVSEKSKEILNLASQFPRKSQKLDIHSEKHFEGLQKRKLTSRSLAKIYLAKSDKVGRNRKEKEQHLFLYTQEAGTRNGNLCLGCIYTF